MHVYVYNVFWCLCYLVKLPPNAGVKRSRAASNSGMYVCICMLLLYVTGFAMTVPNHTRTEILWHNIRAVNRC